MVFLVLKTRFKFICQTLTHNFNFGHIFDIFDYIQGTVLEKSCAE